MITSTGRPRWPAAPTEADALLLQPHRPFAQPQPTQFVVQRALHSVQARQVALRGLRFIHPLRPMRQQRLAVHQDAARNGLPPKPQAPTPRRAPDLAFLHANATAGAAMAPAITWIGHASVMAQLGGLNLLTDPIFSERASPLPFIGPRRHVPPGLAPSELPRIDLVLVSHNHYDHLDAASVDALQAQAGGPPLFIVPLGLQRWLAGRGITHAVELDWWQSHRVAAPQGDVDVMLAPAQHWSARGLTDRMATLWGGFAVFAPDCHLFFAGDTGCSKDFTDLRAHVAERQRPEAGGGFDIALLPIGAYEPRWFSRKRRAAPEFS